MSKSIEISRSEETSVSNPNFRNKLKQNLSKEDPTQEPSNSKTSFPSISNAEIEVLILGTLPGDRSLQSGEYFAHPRNRFWKIIANITNNNLPENYSVKQDLLLKSGIGVWNVLQKADRKGSLDTAIQNEVPNDIPAFIENHKKLKVIGFDGLKVEAFFDKYFSRRSDLTYISLPSCSPANARFNLESLCDKWKELLDYK